MLQRVFLFIVVKIISRNKVAETEHGDWDFSVFFMSLQKNGYYWIHAKQNLQPQTKKSKINHEASQIDSTIKTV